MANRTVTLMSTLLELHQVQEPEAVLPLLLRRMAPEYGRAVAACYLPDGAGGDFRLELLADTGRALNPRVWESELRAPLSLPGATAAPALTRLAAADPVTLTGPLAALLDGLWPGETAARLQRALQIRFAAAAPVCTAQGPAGLVLLLLQERWPVSAAVECAAHAAAALARLLERRDAAQADADVLTPTAIHQVAAREINRAQRYGRTLSIAVLDQPGEGPSPVAQRALAALASRVMRQPDTAGHLDERRVVVLLPETGAAGTAVFLRRLHGAAAADLASLRGGWATFPEDGRGFAELLSAADGRLASLRATTAGDPWTADGSTAAGQPAATGAHTGRSVSEAVATVRVRVAPLAGEEVPRWESLLERLPAALAAEQCGFDGFAATFDVHVPSVTRLLTELQRLAAKVGAELTPTITGEVGFTLRAADAQPGERAARAGLHGAADGALEPDLARRLAHLHRRRARGGWLRPAAALLVAAALTPTIILATSSRAGRSGPVMAEVAAGTPAAAAASPEPAAAPIERRLARDLSGACLPEPGQAACDALRAGLWSGDIDTWRRWAELRGEPAPTPAQVLARTVAMRLAVNDPAARQDLARRDGQALPVIAGVVVRVEAGRQRTVAVEIVNLGVATADLSGASIAGTDVRIPAGASLAPGQRCTLGSAAADGACPFSAGRLDTLDGAAGTRLRLLAADGRELDSFVVP